MIVLLYRNEYRNTLQTSNKHQPVSQICWPTHLTSNIKIRSIKCRCVCVDLCAKGRYVRWWSRLTRLRKVGSTFDKVENAVVETLCARRVILHCITLHEIRLSINRFTLHVRPLISMLLVPCITVFTTRTAFDAVDPSIVLGLESKPTERRTFNAHSPKAESQDQVPVVSSILWPQRPAVSVGLLPARHRSAAKSANLHRLEIQRGIYVREGK